MENKIIEISSNDLRKALPDVAWNAAEDTFFAVWAAAPGMESSSSITLFQGRKFPLPASSWADPLRCSKPTIS